MKRKRRENWLCDSRVFDARRRRSNCEKEVMNLNRSIQALALTTLLVTAGCTTVVEKRPEVTSTTTTEQRTVQPLRGATTETTTTRVQ